MPSKYTVEQTEFFRQLVGYLRQALLVGAADANPATAVRVNATRNRVPLRTMNADSTSDIVMFKNVDKLSRDDVPYVMADVGKSPPAGGRLDLQATWYILVASWANLEARWGKG